MMAQPGQYLEVEVKLWVEDLTAFAARLAMHGALLVHPRVLEQNMRYENAESSLTSRGIVLRLRQDSRARLTYKGPALASAAPGLQTRYEVEVTVDDFDRMDLILQHLGFQHAMRYEKYRTTFSFRGAEIALDEMPYGSFVEIEGAPDAIQRVIADLELEGVHQFAQSYAQLFEYVRANLELQMQDLTFANFKGISVPFEALQPPGE